jgi:hypothetical protein
VTLGVEQALQALGVLVGLVVSIWTLRNLPARTRKRSTLKADIEIYRLLDESDSRRHEVKASIDAAIDRLYGPGTNRKIKDVSSFVVGVVMLAVFGAWAADLLKDGFRWWSIPTAFFALVGAVGIGAGFDEPAKQDAAKDEHGNEVAGEES